MTNYVVMLDSGSGAGMTFNTIVMADLIRHLESRFRVEPGMTQEGEAGMTKAVMLDSGSGAGMTQVCKAGMTKEGYARFRLGGRNDVWVVRHGGPEPPSRFRVKPGMTREGEPGMTMKKSPAWGRTFYSYN